MEFKDERERESKKTKSVKGLQANHETTLGLENFLEFARQDLSSEAASLDNWDLGELNDVDDQGAWDKGCGFWVKVVGICKRSMPKARPWVRALRMQL